MWRKIRTRAEICNCDRVTVKMAGNAVCCIGILKSSLKPLCWINWMKCWCAMILKQRSEWQYKQRKIELTMKGNCNTHAHDVMCLYLLYIYNRNFLLLICDFQADFYFFLIYKPQVLRRIFVYYTNIRSIC